MREQDLLLRRLLDAFERSSHYREIGASPRSVVVKFDRKSMPEYWDETDLHARKRIDAAVAALESTGLITARRSRYDRQEVERVDLVLTHVAEAYRRCGRTPLRELEGQLANEARCWQWMDWRGRFVQDLITAVDEFKRLPAGFGPEESVLLRDICRVLDALPGSEAEVPRRQFSQQVLGDSKRLEEIEGRLLRLLRDYHPAGELEAHDLLAEVGIVPNPQPLLIAGPVSLEAGGTVIDVGGIGAEVGLPLRFIRQCRVLSCAAERLITVENLTSFYEVVGDLPPRTLVIYLGGYHQPARRGFIRQFAGLRLWHWGDIDLGGFQIFVHLCRGTGLSFEPLWMDQATFERHQAGGRSFDAGYGRRLKELLSKSEYGRFYSVIEAMLESGRRVEQEAVRFHFATSQSPG